MNYTIWEVNGKEYKLKLTASTTQELEKKLGGSLMETMSKGIPPLKTTLDIVHCSMKKYNHGISRSEVDDIYDDYVEAGGSLMDLFTVNVMDILRTSGFFSPKQAKAMEKKREEALEKMDELED